MKKQRKHINLSRITAFILSVAMLAGFCPQGVSFADIPITLPKVNAAENISNPRIVKDSSMDAGQKVTWDCVYFGRYPQSEITSKDGSIYNTLKNATGWDENNDITIGETKYRRLKGEDATYASTQKNAIKTTNVVNNNNIDYGTAGGNNTSDKVFLLSESEVYNTDTAAGYGFVKDSETDDEARRSRCSTYAYAMGTYKYYDTDKEYTKYNENIYWWLRSPGSYSYIAAEVNN